jgi:hypothetical protein
MIIIKGNISLKRQRGRKKRGLGKKKKVGVFKIKVVT